MHLDSIGGLVKLSAIVVSAVGVAMASFYDSAAASIGIAAGGVVAGLVATTLVGVVVGALRSTSPATVSAPVEAFVAATETSDAPQI